MRTVGLLTMKTCPCGNEITKDQHCIETPAQFAKRYDSGYCRSKCGRIYAPAKKDRTTGILSASGFVYARPDMVAQEKELPVRDLARLAFARSMPCFTCGSIEGIHAHHEQEPGQGTMGGKTSDRRTVPLCYGCHQLRHETSRSFWGNVDVERYISDLNDAYDCYVAHKKG